MKFLFFLILLAFSFNPSQAEPWMANRYAQNCAGCHAPGRMNLAPSKRRCTLSCQGCHTNPNGGGLRNQYGKWNQQRWAKSFFNKETLRNKYLPAPLGSQPYHKELMSHSKKKKVSKKGKGKSRKVASAKKSKRKKRLYRFKKIKAIDVDEALYDKYHDEAWLTEAKDWKTFLSTIPENDPYRLEREEMITASGDLRYFFFSGSSETNGTESDIEGNGFMSLDVGVRVRPIAKYLSGVYEARMGANPRSDKQTLKQFDATSYTRSAYLLLDELPFNTYVMGGIFRPMFGHYNPDHRALSQVMTGLTQWKRFHGISVGTAPNVPFFNFSYLFNEKGRAGDKPIDGFVANAGLRFVTLGASTKFSYWSTKDEDNGKRTMYSLTMGGVLFKRLILNGEFLRTGTTDNSGGYHEGSVYTLESKYRLWRENYVMFNYGLSNVAQDHTEGSASEMLVGLKGFLFPGMEMELSYILRDNEVKSSNTKTASSFLQFQTHLFF